MIRLSRDLIKEKWKRDIYNRWIGEIITRRNAGECPKCGIREWYQIETGFRAKWQCEKCGMILNKQDIADGQKWWDYVTLLARKEIKRIKTRKRQSQPVKTYESDNI